METDFLSNAKDWFGGRVTNYEALNFLKSIPTLMNSQEGRREVIKKLRFMEQAKQLATQEMLDIEKENKGIPPLNLMEQVYERSGKKFDQLADKFKEQAATN